MSFCIDCPPGGLRPDAHLHNMCQALGLPEAMFVPESRLFGCWTWQIQDREAYAAAVPAIKAHLVALHAGGHIRYAEW